MKPPEARDRFDEALTPDFGYHLRAAVVHREDSPYQRIEILHSDTFGHVLRLDGALQCSERDEFLYHEPLVHVALMRSARPTRVLVVGGGDGGAVEEVLKWPQVERVDHVEIDAAVVACSRRWLHGVHRGALDASGGRHQLHIADAFDWIARQPDQSFGAVILDLTDEGGPSSRLYANAFLAQCRRVLRTDGAASLHLAAPWAQRATCERLVERLRVHFTPVLPYTTSVLMSGGPWLMATCGGATPTRQHITQNLARLEGPPLQLVDEDYVQAVGRMPPYLAHLQDRRPAAPTAAVWPAPVASPAA